MKIIAVIVTYNRLELLKKSVKAVSAQTHQPDEIIVINNGSTDGTEAWLKTKPVTLVTTTNEGGAGGFAFGIEVAYTNGADWIWLMDDDTIPQKDALEHLVDALENLKPDHDHIGFLAGSVVWTDGSEHEMNRTYTLNDKKKLEKLTLEPRDKYRFVQFGTFVSMLLSAKAVEKVGLPIKEYFIWNDDVEYSKRIIKHGMAGLAVEDSVVLHETPINHISNVFRDTEKNLWKYRYGLRNELFTKRSHQGELQFWITWIHRMLIMPFRIVLGRKTHHWPFIKTVWNTSLRAVMFRPGIRHVKARTSKTFQAARVAERATA
ncbi:glycosyltransferase family 2 protein [Mucilaginibacter sp. RS28]|uniref:Glycosyltransferase family 2 protein n=1 Tax=Mucilaginibacter straminoryzae TaxID=2932774 RepID=A0A9X1X6S5_9SPHI|nr:glycosyltransferase family 2 protein [Mucilaginibacter straminoryzae]MCJ8211976.1 glycosyltransferase family 2 protein [Mucilaginibacter straminoryzae]